MHWGIRRYQNKDGSLTNDGKKRYGQKERKSLGDPYEQNKRLISKEAAKAYSDYDKTKMFMASEEYGELANELGDDYKRYFDSLKTNKEFQNKVYEDMRKDFGDGSDDEEYFELVASEYFFDRLRSNTPSDIKDKLERFEDAKNRYFGEVEKATKDLVEKYKDVQVSEYDTWPTKSYIQNEFLQNYDQAMWNGYLARHFEDYWFAEPAYEVMPEIINQEGYNEYVKKHK